MIKHDGHIHTPFCPHGSADAFSDYIEQAIKQGFTSVSFTEHAPLPLGFSDPVPDQDSALAYDLLPKYIESCNEMKTEYAEKITIYTGLEVDYIEGYEEETRHFLNEWGRFVDDAILSVHFLQPEPNTYICLDFSPDSFQSLINQCGSLEKVYQLYYRTLLLSIHSNLGPFKPTRIGHMTLVRKFQKLFPRTFDDEPTIHQVMAALKKQNMSIDINAAGLAKQHCLETYPPVAYLSTAKELGIPFVYGSDSHSSDQIGIGIKELERWS